MKLSELRAVFELLLNRMQCMTSEGKLVMRDEYYWHVPNDKLIVSETSLSESDLTVGQLSEDVSALLRCLDNPENLVSLDVEKFANVLRFAALSLNGGVW